MSIVLRQKNVIAIVCTTEIRIWRGEYAKKQI